MTEKFEFRNIRPDEAEQAVEIEQICFPPNEACSPKSMRKRTEHASETFLVAVDKATGKIAGFLNGVATDEEVFRDEFFTDITLHDPKGKNIMLLGLDVLPEYRHQGLAREIMTHYAAREQAKGRKCLLPKGGTALLFRPGQRKTLPFDSRHFFGMACFKLPHAPCLPCGHAHENNSL